MDHCCSRVPQTSWGGDQWGQRCIYGALQRLLFVCTSTAYLYFLYPAKSIIKLLYPSLSICLPSYLLLCRLRSLPLCLLQIHKKWRIYTLPWTLEALLKAKCNSAFKPCLFGLQYFTNSLLQWYLWPLNKTQLPHNGGIQNSEEIFLFIFMLSPQCRQFCLGFISCLLQDNS